MVYARSYQVLEVFCIIGNLNGVHLSQKQRRVVARELPQPGRVFVEDLLFQVLDDLVSGNLESKDGAHWKTPYETVDNDLGLFGHGFSSQRSR